MAALLLGLDASAGAVENFAPARSPVMVVTCKIMPKKGEKENNRQKHFLRVSVSDIFLTESCFRPGLDKLKARTL